MKRMTVMSTFSIVGLIILTAVITLGTICKICISKKRKKLDGCHGYVIDEETNDKDDDKDGWSVI